MPLKSGSSRKVMAANYRELRSTGRFSPKQMIAIMLSKAGKSRRKKKHGKKA